MQSPRSHQPASILSSHIDLTSNSSVTCLTITTQRCRSSSWAGAGQIKSVEGATQDVGTLYMVIWIE